MVVDLKRKEADLLGQLQGHSKADEAFLISSSYVLELANRAEELFEKSQVKQQNELLRFVLANASVEGEKLVYKLKNPFAGIVLCNETGNWLGRRDSNPRMHGPKPCALPLGDSPIMKILVRKNDTTLLPPSEALAKEGGDSPILIY